MSTDGSRGSLSIVGTGMSLASHLTSQGLAELQHADQVFYCLTSGVEDEWITMINPAAASLMDCYGDDVPRELTYARIVERILAAVREGKRVCVAYYGHPGVFAWAPHEAVRRARREGYQAVMQPGISAADCLFADLGIDPADRGCQMFEATDFVRRQPQYDSATPLILWQVGLMGQSSGASNVSSAAWHLQQLTDALRSRYGRHHAIALYEAAHFPNEPHKVDWRELDQLPSALVTIPVTLYIPPVPIDAADDHAASQLASSSSAPRS
ncbi:MAG: SAM-dependent methyltransferase [Vicinamibacterales bacterium]